MRPHWTDAGVPERERRYLRRRSPKVPLAWSEQSSVVEQVTRVVALRPQRPALFVRKSR